MSLGFAEGSQGFKRAVKEGRSTEFISNRELAQLYPNKPTTQSKTGNQVLAQGRPTIQDAPLAYTAQRSNSDRQHKGASYALFASANAKKSKIPGILESREKLFKTKEGQIGQFRNEDQTFFNKLGKNVERADQSANPYTQGFGDVIRGVGKKIRSKAEDASQFVSPIDNFFKGSPTPKVIAPTVKYGVDFLGGTVQTIGRQISQNPASTIGGPVAIGATFGVIGGALAGTAVAPFVAGGALVLGVGSFGYGL